MATPSSQVFGTVELLEMVLLASSTRDILIHQRVCKQWKQVVAESVKLQQALYVRADGLTHSGLTFRRRRNTLLDSLMPPNPSHGTISVDWYGKLVVSEPWKRAEASWKSMLPTRPAMTSIKLFLYVWRENREFEEQVQNDTGVTFGDVMAKVEEVWVQAAWRRERRTEIWKVDTTWWQTRL